MDYSKICEVYATLESTSKGLEKTEILASFLGEIRDERDTLNAFIDESTTSGNTAIQRKRASGTRAIKQTNAVIGGATRDEIGLENKDILNTQRLVI